MLKEIHLENKMNQFTKQPFTGALVGICSENISSVWIAKFHATGRQLQSNSSLSLIPFYELSKVFREVFSIYLYRA